MSRSQNGTFYIVRVVLTYESYSRPRLILHLHRKINLSCQSLLAILEVSKMSYVLFSTLLINPISTSLILITSYFQLTIPASILVIVKPHMQLLSIQKGSYTYRKGQLHQQPTPLRRFQKHSSHVLTRVFEWRGGPTLDRCL